jgi:hypothetical protein
MITLVTKTVYPIGVDIANYRDEYIRYLEQNPEVFASFNFPLNFTPANFYWLTTSELEMQPGCISRSTTITQTDTLVTELHENKWETMEFFDEWKRSQLALAWVASRSKFAELYPDTEHGRVSLG